MKTRNENHTSRPVATPEEIERFIDEQNSCGPAYEKYDYAKYQSINPKLTEEMYRWLWENELLWKVVCGKRIQNHLSCWPALEAVWWLDTPENNRKRFAHGYPELEESYQNFIFSKNEPDGES